MIKAQGTALTTLRRYAAVANSRPVPNNKPTLNRFWKTVDIAHIGNSFRITLDGRPVKTPANQILEIPDTKQTFAALIAHEWDTRENIISTHALLLVRSSYLPKRDQYVLADKSRCSCLRPTST